MRFSNSLEFCIFSSAMPEIILRKIEFLILESSKKENNSVHYFQTNYNFVDNKMESAQNARIAI